MKKIWTWAVLFSVLLLCAGCGQEEERLEDLDFTIVEQGQVPAQLGEMIENKKANEFQLSYGDKESLYLVVGYGAKGTGGYSIQVTDLFLTADNIVLNTELIGPLGVPPEGITYPVVIVKTQWRDEIVEFR